MCACFNIYSYFVRNFRLFIQTPLLIFRTHIITSGQSNLT